MDKNGFTNIEIKGFELFGEFLHSNILPIYSKKTGGFKARINNNTSLMYISVKQSKPNKNEYPP